MTTTPDLDAIERRCFTSSEKADAAKFGFTSVLLDFRDVIALARAQQQRIAELERQVKVLTHATAQPIVLQQETSGHDQQD